MFGPLTYLLWLLLFIFLPLFALVVRQRQVWRHWRSLGLILAGSLVGGWAWDAPAVRQRCGQLWCVSRHQPMFSNGAYRKCGKVFHGLAFPSFQRYTYGWR